MRLQRLFPRISTARRSDRPVMKIQNNDEVCRDLEWFCERFPLEVTPRSHMRRRARAHEDLAEACVAILSGEREPMDFPLALPPRAYQSQAAELAIRTGGLLVADDLGVGKTVTAICMLASAGSLPALVVCPIVIVQQWKAQIERFAPGLVVHVGKKGTPPESLADKKTGKDPDVIVLNYAKLAGWAGLLAGRVRAVVYDEAQELRRQTSDKYRAADMISQGAVRRMGLTATPIYNHGDEFYSVLSVLRPGVLGDYEEFSREWMGADDRIKDPHAFGSYLRENAVMIRRTRKEVGREIPTLTRVVVEVDSDTKVLDDVETAATELAHIILARSGGLTTMRAASDFSMLMRQATGIAKAKFVAAFVSMLLESHEPVILFGWHRAVYDLWAEAFKDHAPAWFTGEESAPKKQAELKRFLDGETNLIIMSLRSGAGTDGMQERCATVVFGEFDWSPGAMDQCVGRAHRDEQKRPVTAYYLAARDGCDPYMIDVLGVKREQLEAVRDPDAALVEASGVDPEHMRKLAALYLERKRKAAP